MKTVQIRFKTDVFKPAAQAGRKGEVKEVPIAVARRLVEDSLGLYAEYVDNHDRKGNDHAHHPRTDPPADPPGK